jgi:hypothetical protein
LVEFLEEYRPYVKFCCEKKQFLKNYFEDMESFVCTELIALFHKRNKYTDFDWVVRCVVRRKVQHYVGTFVRKNKKLVFPSNEKESSGDDKERSETSLVPDEKTYEYMKHKTVNDEEIKKSLKETVEVVRNLFEKIKVQPLCVHFTDWDREYMEVVMELYDLDSELDKKDIMECMGYEKGEVAQFNSKLLSLRIKLSSYFNVEEF